MIHRSPFCARDLLGIRIWTSSLCALAGMMLASEAALAGSVIFDEVIVGKGVERQNGVIVDATPYFFEICIAGPNISELTLPTAQTPPSTNFPSGSMQTLNKDGDEFCFEQGYASAAARDADFSSGNYTVSATDVAELATDSKQVNYAETVPTAYPAITMPVNNAVVSLTNSTTVSWGLVDNGGCTLGSPATCFDFFFVTTFSNPIGLPEDEVDVQFIMDPTATGTTIPGATFMPGGTYTIEVETIRATQTNETTDDLGQVVLVQLFATDINGVEVTGELPTQPINEVLMFKGFDRVDGVPVVNPYFIEICVFGSDIPITPMMALPTVQTPISMDFPMGDTQFMPNVDGSEFCFEAGNFANSAALEAAYPNGTYTVTVTDNSMSTDTAILNYGVLEPSGFPAVFDPLNGAMVPFDQNLDIQWGSITAKDMSCDPVTPSSCADGFLIFAVDLNLDDDVDIQQLSISSGAATIDSSLLQPGTPYGLEVESFRGSLSVPTTSDTLANSIQITMLYEDINFIGVTTIPEPSGAAMQFSALLALMWTARRRHRG